MNLSLKGRAEICVIDHEGTIVAGPVSKKNLLLDQGMDAIADNLIADIFSVGVKGHGDHPTTEIVDNANSYTVTSLSVERVAGTRDFTADDEGKIAYFRGSGVSDNVFAKIAAFVDATHVDLAEELSEAIAAKNLTLFDVAQIELEDEDGLEDLVGITFDKVEGDDTITASGAAFAADDVNKILFLKGAKLKLRIDSFTDATHVEATVVSGTDQDVAADEAFMYEPRDTEDFGPPGRSTTYSSKTTENGTTTTNGKKEMKRTFIFEPEPQMPIVVAGTYSRAGTNVHRDTGVRDFVLADVGRVIKFADGTETTITAFVDLDDITVADSGAIAAQAITLYDYTTYQEIGFSHLDEPGDNLNIRIALDAPLQALGATSLKPGQQLKVTYYFTATVSPIVETSVNLSSVINDPGSDMSANKSGWEAIEGFALSQVRLNGATDDDFAILDPAVAGDLAYSRDSSVLEPLTNKVRESSVVTTPFEAQDYTAGNYFRLYTGAFGLNDAIGNDWRSLMLYEPESGVAVFTHLFNHNQRKSADRVFSMTLRKFWNRDLS